MARIMVVDDAIVIREKLKILLTKAGHEVVCEAGNGIQAAQLYSKYKPDIVTMDITMPEMDGLEGIRKIKDSDADAMVLVISAMGNRAIIVEALEAGASGFILKPFDVKKILSTIETMEAQIRSGNGADADRIKAEMESLKKEKGQLDSRLSMMDKKDSP